MWTEKNYSNICLQEKLSDVQREAEETAKALAERQGERKEVEEKVPSSYIIWEITRVITNIVCRLNKDTPHFPCLVLR